ncbi:MAG TPA: hypothetical protein VFY65_11395, partial [Longimicrobium sp.]|nr:hypothetical protein [Longimicrobium sp.]
PGASTGALIGALALGGTAMFLSQGLCETEDRCVGETVMIGAAGAATGGTIGALLGAVAGHATRTWRRIYPW